MPKSKRVKQLIVATCVLAAAALGGGIVAILQSTLRPDGGGGSGGLSGLTVGQPPGRPDANARIKEELALSKAIVSAMNGPYYLKGVVVDGGGTPLQGVKMTFGATKMINVMAGKNEVKTITVNGSFEVDFPKALRVGIDISCEGYYTRHLEIARDPLSKNQLLVVKEMGRALPGLRPDNLRIVLDSSKNQANLLRRDICEISRDPNGPRTVLALNFTGDADLHTLDAGREVYLKSDDPIPDHCMYIVVDKSVDEQSAEDNSRPSGRGAFVPTGFKVVMSSADDGFVVFPRQGVNVFDDMKTAPADGYVPALVPDTDFFVKPVLEGWEELLYFYFKADGKYGKGCIMRPRRDRGESRVYLKVSLHFQPDGTRNLETRDW